MHSVHIIFHQHLYTLHHSTHIITPYIVQHGITHLMARTLASLAEESVVMVGWDLGGRQVTIQKGVPCGRPPLVGLPLGKHYDIFKHKKDFILNVLYMGYMYTCTDRKINHVYLLEYILGDMEKQHCQGLKVSLLHSLHVAKYILSTRSSTIQVYHIEIWKCCTSLCSRFSLCKQSWHGKSCYNLKILI